MVSLSRVYVFVAALALFSSASYAQTTWYVDASASGVNDGTSWTDAFTFLQDALAAAGGSSGADEIWVAAGTYYPDDGAGQTVGDPTETFQLLDDVSIYGGFSGGEASLGLRDPSTHTTVLSGDSAGNDATGFVNYGDNSYHVVTATGAGETSRLDGFTITGGSATGGGSDGFGGGVLNYGSAPNPGPIIAQCIFQANQANYGGAAMILNNAFITLKNCTFRGNRANSQGGGVYASASTTGIFITNCIFQDNTSFTGGGLYAHRRIDVTNGVFIGNSVESAPASTNISVGGGGAVYSFSGNNLDPVYANCTFTKNSAKRGGAMQVITTGNTSARPQISNSIFWDNSATISNDEIDNNGNAELLSNIIAGSSTVIPLCPGDAGQSGCGIDCRLPDLGCDQGGNIDDDPDFVDADGLDDVYGTADDDVRLLCGSPAIDAGNDSAIPADVSDLDDDSDTAETTPFDLDGLPRIQFVTVDMGAYEANAVGGPPDITACSPPDTVECGGDTSPVWTGTATDSCTGESLTPTPTDSTTAGSCPEISIITRTWSATTSSGTATCDQTITVVDMTDPAITVPDDVTIGFSEDSTPANTGSATATDGCDSIPAVSFSDSTTPGACAHEFTITRTWTAMDACGNSQSGDQTITVEDDVAPLAVCQDVTVQLDASGSGGIVASDVDGGSSDACGIGTLSVSGSTFGCADVGTNGVTLTVTDVNGNSSDCSATVTVEDNVAPTAVCQDITVQLDGTGHASIVASDVDGGSSDACGTGSLSVSTSSFTCAELGLNSVTLSATDNNGNIGDCAATVTVEDIESPSITCPADSSLECPADTGSGSTGVATGTDNCGAPTLGSADATTNGCGDTSSITRTWTATDGSGNQISCDQMITESDSSGPSITCPADVLNLPCGSDTGEGTTGSPTGSDTCGNVTFASSDASVAGCGLTETITRTFTGTDDCGNETPCDQTITTVDNDPPTLTVDTTPIDAVDTDCSGDESVTLPTATSSDDCDGAVSVTDDAPASFPAGDTTTVTFSAVDDCGNEATDSVDVSVDYGANILVKAKKYTVGFGWHPSISIEKLDGIEVVAFEKYPGSCAWDQLDDHFWFLPWALPDIFDTCTPISSATTNSNGIANLNVPPGHYVVASYFDSDDDGVLDQYLGQFVLNLDCGETDFQYLVMFSVATGKRHSCRWYRYLGSELLVFEPEEIIWDSPEQNYPFVFDSEGDWGVTTSVEPPEGFVSDYEELSTDVDNEVEALQFTITEVGSDIVPTKTTFEITHHGRKQILQSDIKIRLTPEYARSRGFNVEDLRSRGLIHDPKSAVKEREQHRPSSRTQTRR